MKLVRMLKRAHAIEVGAYHAYEGHWRSLPIGRERREIKKIQDEELAHRKEIVSMLERLGAKPNRVLDFVFFLIGKSTSFACRFMSKRLAMWGAKVMEKLGGVCYFETAMEAEREGYSYMEHRLRCMQYVEERHERFFQEELDCEHDPHHYTQDRYEMCRKCGKVLELAGKE